MPLLTDIREAACAYLREALPDALRIEAYAGQMDLESLAPRGVQYSEKASIFLAAGECRNVGENLCCDMEATFWAFIVARHAARPTVAASAALSLAQAAVLAIHGNNFGLGGVSPANVRQLSPVVDEELARSGVHAWELRFTMRVAFTEVL